MKYFLLFGFWILFCLSGVIESAADSLNEGRVHIEAGEFMMGDTYCMDEQGNSDWCSDEVPHRVRLGAYSIDRYEVTNEEYLKCFEAGVCEPALLHEDRPKEFDRPTQPVVFVSWEDAETFCRWRGGRLPTEAEWERAAQAEDLGGAHFKQPYNQGAPKPVGAFRPNSRGLYDMMGNVYEWTRDWYGPPETPEVSIDPRGPETAKEKIVRGGSWNSPAHYLRPADRVARSPQYKYSDVGFRCVYKSDE